LKFLNYDRDLEIHYDGDLPARSGMGSSSAFTVGLLNALYAYEGKVMSCQQLVEESIHVEQVLVKEKVGSQDQVSAAHGGFNMIRFLPEGEIEIEPLPIDSARVDSVTNKLMLFFTGISRTASEVAETYVHDLRSRARQLHRLSGMVDEAKALVCSDSELDNFGELLHESWILKRSLSPAVSNTRVDEAYTAARESGALGGKLTGAGGGGMLLLYVPEDRQAMVRTKLASLVHIPIQFENTGSQIIFRDIQQKYQTNDRCS